VVLPARIVTDAGDTVTFVVSLLLSVTVTPPAGAGAGKVTVSAADCPRFTLMLGILIAPALCTITEAVASGIFGSALP
jgi:hypothetical protein